MANALIIVDVQNDFCEGGALAVAGGNDVAYNIGSYLTENADSYDLVVTTQDWHNSLSSDPTGNNGHFAIPPTAPDFDKTWPVHCVAGTEGAELHPELLYRLETVLRFPAFDYLNVRKGQGVDAYSGFDGSVSYPGRFAGAGLAAVLNSFGVDTVDICGLTTDYCVGETAHTAGEDHMYDTTVLTNLCAAVDPVVANSVIKSASARIKWVERW